MENEIFFSDRQSWLFTGVLPNGYDPPSSFCYDFVCADEPIMVTFIAKNVNHCCIVSTLG